MSTDSPAENDKNWLEGAVDERSTEVYQKAMLGVFHRMRVVDWLFSFQSITKSLGMDPKKT